jgi:hypothetical protein
MTFRASLLPFSFHHAVYFASIWRPPQPQQWRLNDTNAQGDQVVV